VLALRIKPGIVGNPSGSNAENVVKAFHVGQPSPSGPEFEKMRSASEIVIFRGMLKMPGICKTSVRVLSMKFSSI
jgi:hypothetical protein